MYNSAREGDFVAVEIQEGLPVAIIGKGGTKTELRSLMFINDRKWHSIKLHFSSKNLELNVDGEMVKSSISSRSKGFQLKGYLFVGGIDDSTRAEVRKVGLLSVSGKRVRGGSFKGCLKNIEVNRVKMGLSNAVVTKDISVGCEPEREPEPSTTVSPTSAPQSPFHLMTTTPSLHMSTLARGLDRRYGSNFVHLKNLVVPEGGRASLEAKHIKVLLDFKKLGIRQSQIMFRIQEQPIHGQIRLDVDPDQEENTFSMLDLWHGRAMYIHGGSEEPDDFFMFSIYSSSRKEVPDYLKGNKLYRYNITVTPTNDAPELSLPEGNLFVLLENSKKRLTTDVLKATDIDSSYTDLVFSVLGNLNADAGYLELENNPGKAVTSFSYLDLEELRVYYVHTGVRNSRIVLRVSDGEKVSNTVVLRVMAVALEYKIANNTGLAIIQGESAIIGTKQLSVHTNAVKQIVDIRVVSNLDIRDDQEVIFQLDEAPKYGGLYRNEIKVDSFSQFDLKSGLISYRHDDSKHLADYFNLTVKAKDLRLAASINVKVFLESHQRPPIVQHHNILLVEEGKPVKIDETKLEVTHEDNLPSDIVFTVKVAPFHGFLRRFVKERYVGTKQSPVKTFTQEDINSGNIQYMQVSNITLNEGASKSLTQDVLKVTNRHFSGINFLYSLTEPPQHGHIEHSRHPGVPITSFTRRQVEHEFIYYVHDSSETLDDNFTVVVNDTGLRKQSAAQTVYIQVTAVNDEPPVITANRVLRVWVSSVTEIRPEDLRVHDMDSPPEELHFMAHIDQGQLLFVHKGAMSGGFNFQVNDGVNFTPRQIFSITARALVLSLEKNRPLMVFPGSSTPITNEDLQVVTNDVTNTTNRIITFSVIRHPKLGRLVMKQPDNSTVDISTFTQDMVDRKEVLYIQTPIESVGWEAMDSITFSVTSPPTSLDGQTFKIDISYENTGPEHNTVLLANTGAEVTEGESVVIDESKLDATNLMSKLPTPQRSLHEVWFQVTSLPQHGVIVVGERNLTKEKPNFSQFIINKYEVTEITITLVNYTGLTLEQGQTSVSLTQDNLAAESNGKNITIHYQVTKPPNFGKLLMDNQEVTQFEQEDLQSGRLSYHMISLSSAEDSFEFTAFTSEANLTGQVFNITVRPLIQVGKGLRIPNGIVVKLNTSFLNAFELANISNSDPVFEIISHPKVWEGGSGKT
ncbi:Chondroitin sulfate proteoglycan 4 [Larimichthys crocea]|uniref:Chondroitin sulfate proteoglycan 4 n=1 Tax=Larimichthys crocea TaxID=215358 RepID=A0A6G0IKV1_LARCR|nr:Chondroitin sulfate proteoglycan 4 [Larimichthys crocea]